MTEISRAVHPQIVSVCQGIRDDLVQRFSPVYLWQFARNFCHRVSSLRNPNHYLDLSNAYRVTRFFDKRVDVQTLYYTLKFQLTLSFSPLPGLGPRLDMRTAVVAFRGQLPRGSTLTRYYVS